MAHEILLHRRFACGTYLATQRLATVLPESLLQRKELHDRCQCRFMEVGVGGAPQSVKGRSFLVVSGAGHTAKGAVAWGVPTGDSPPQQNWKTRLRAAVMLP